MVTWAIPEKHRAWHMVCARGDPGEPVSWGQSSAVGFKERSGPALDECRAVGGADDSGAQAALPRGRDPPPEGPLSPGGLTLTLTPWRVCVSTCGSQCVSLSVLECTRACVRVNTHVRMNVSMHTCR